MISMTVVGLDGREDKKKRNKTAERVGEEKRRLGISIKKAVQTKGEDVSKIERERERE